MRYVRTGLLVLVLSLVSFLVGIPASFASGNEQISDIIYVQTENVSRQQVQYALDSMPDIVREIPNLGIDRTTLNDDAKLSYGHPFILGEFSYFPLLTNGKVIALVAISSDSGQLGWSVSAALASELNSLSGKTSFDNPAQLFAHNGNIFARLSGNEVKLTDYPAFDEPRTKISVDGSVVALNQPLYDSNIQTRQTYYQDKSIGTAYLKLDLKERQGNQHWCSAFAGAQILRYRGKGNIRAYNIMKYFFPKSKNLAHKGISNSQLIKYANIKRSYPRRVLSTISDDLVKRQINAAKPIYLGAAGKDRYKKTRHALVLRGYNSTTYSVWNPWNKFYSSISKKTKVLPVSGGSFTWDTTIYNW